MIRPALRAHPEIVDELRSKLPPTYLKLPEVRRLLAISETTMLDDSETLAALVYLESRGEVRRANRRGWKLVGPPSFITAVGGSPGCSTRATPVTLFDQTEYNTYNQDGELC